MASQIQTVTGLDGLASLERLVLSHNQIHSLAGLAPDRFQVHGARLMVLELHDNALASLATLDVLTHCTALRELTLQVASLDSSNPVCREEGYADLRQVCVSLVLLFFFLLVRRCLPLVYVSVVVVLF